ncbi:hypothetical protein VE03_10150 [Pseudogymnoascus sp. 23342-1-I1]|nr:hypothetical protein VE03_10150 [Pseudogymnoascus sp. 23342-1-I1]
MDFGHFDVDAYLQLLLDNPNVPTAPVAPMASTSPMAAVLSATPPLTAPEILELDWLPHDAIETTGLNHGGDLCHQDNDLRDYYEETAPEILELDWLPHDAIETTGLNHGGDLCH